MLEFEKKRQVPRYGLAVDAEVTDLESGVQLRGRTTDVAMFGCGVIALSDFARGTRVRVRLIRAGTEIIAFGRIVYARSDLGMGIAFTTVEPRYERALTEWIDEVAIHPVQQSQFE
jgi:hypothetical protein